MPTDLLAELIGVDLCIVSCPGCSGDSIIRDHLRFQSNVSVCKISAIGSYMWVLPCVNLTDDLTPLSDQLTGCRIENFASISAASVVLPGVTVGHHALVAAKDHVTKDVSPHTVAAGTPALIVGEASCNIVPIRRAKPV